MPARLLADENIPAKAIEALRVAELDVLSVREHSPGITDEEVLRLAVAQDRVLVTFDRDYGELIFGQRRAPPPSAIYFRIFPSESREVSDTVLSLLADPESIDGIEKGGLDVLDGAFVVVDKTGVRTHIPVGGVACLMLEPGTPSRIRVARRDIGWSDRRSNFKLPRWQQFDVLAAPALVLYRNLQ